MKRLLTAAELANECGVRPRTVQAWKSQGRIPFVRLSRKVIRFELEKVLAALTQFDDLNRKGRSDDCI